MRNARASLSGFVIRHSGVVIPVRGCFVFIFAQHTRKIAEARGRLITRLRVALGEVDAAAVEAAGGAGFEALDVEAELAEAVG
jgi:hypothetical protein